jgi:hypothetical protein
MRWRGASFPLPPSTGGRPTATAHDVAAPVEGSGGIGCDLRRERTQVGRFGLQTTRTWARLGVSKGNRVGLVNGFWVEMKDQIERLAENIFLNLFKAFGFKSKVFKLNLNYIQTRIIQINFLMTFQI